MRHGSSTAKMYLKVAPTGLRKKINDCAMPIECTINSRIHREYHPIRLFVAVLVPRGNNRIGRNRDGQIEEMPTAILAYYCAIDVI